VDSPSAAVEPAVAAGLVDWSPTEPACPVEFRHCGISTRVERELALEGVTVLPFREVSFGEIS
jgi:hypothetical protein